MDAAAQQSTGTSERDHFITVRKADVVHALAIQDELGTQEREQFTQVCRLLSAIYHYQYFDRLDRMRDDYFFFNPEHDGHARFDRTTVERAYQDMMTTLNGVLHAANFVEVTHEEIEHAHREDAIVRVNLHVSVEDYREIRFFRRGHAKEKIEISEWYGWRKREIVADVYDDVLLMVAMKNADELGASNKKKKRTSKVRPGAVLLKYFRHIPSADLNALFPDARVVMSLKDKLWLGVPAVLGGIPIVMKVVSTVTVVFLVAGFYLGVSSAVRDDEMAAALAGVSGLVALGGFGFRQWVKFQRQTLLYQKQLADNIYFRNVNNNAGIFDYLIGAAEDQDCKEAFLAYYFLLTSQDGATEATLDERIEHWLKQRFAADVDFECDDAVAKLEQLGLLRRDGDKLSVLSLQDALVRLDQVWDSFFSYASAAR